MSASQTDKFDLVSGCIYYDGKVKLRRIGIGHFIFRKVLVLKIRLKITNYLINLLNHKAA